tara:strand:- start:715 stop:1227 length:513 start_codon:yes stop_codon:yes gene_type:complete
MLKDKTKKKKNSLTYAAVTIGIIIVVLSVLFTYSGDQTIIKGQMFGEKLQVIQDDLKITTHAFDSKLSMFKEGSLGKNSFLEFAKKHEGEMNRLISLYDGLQIVKGFETAVDLFKLSTETQLESDRQMIEWVKTGNDAAHIRSDILLQESIEYELAALTEYKLAQGTIKP